MRAHEAKTRALAMPYKDPDQSEQKSRKCAFRPFLNKHKKKLFYSLLLIRQKYYGSSKTEYSDSTSFINRLTPLIFFLGYWNFFEGLKGGFPPKKNFTFLLQSFVNVLLQTIKVEIYCCLPTLIWWKSGAEVFLPGGAILTWVRISIFTLAPLAPSHPSLNHI